jgi:hypothetical protein
MRPSVKRNPVFFRCCIIRDVRKRFGRRRIRRTRMKISVTVMVVSVAADSTSQTVTTARNLRNSTISLTSAQPMVVPMPHTKKKTLEIGHGLYITMLVRN